jgi:hypothetical protein
MTVGGTRLFFSANNGTSNVEPFAVDLQPAAAGGTM